MESLQESRSIGLWEETWDRTAWECLGYITEMLGVHWGPRSAQPKARDVKKIIIDMFRHFQILEYIR